MSKQHNTSSSDKKSPDDSGAKIPRSHNINMQFMLPNRANKDVIFNEALHKIDNHLAGTVQGFIPAARAVSLGERFIISENAAKHKNNMLYASTSNTAKIYEPRQGMMVFSIEDNAFFIFYDNKWCKVNLDKKYPDSLKTGDTTTHGNPQDSKQSSFAFDTSKGLSGAAAETESVSKQFTGIAKSFTVPNDRAAFALYLNGDTKIDFSQITRPEITLLIKQCYNSSYNITWNHNILWENNAPHKMTSAPNAMDIIKLYRMPESLHFLGKVVGQNFNF